MLRRAVDQDCCTEAAGRRSAGAERLADHALMTAAHPRRRYCCGTQSTWFRKPPWKPASSETARPAIFTLCPSQALCTGMPTRVRYQAWNVLRGQT